MYLNCHSYYSLRYGTLSPEQLAAEAHRLGVRELALTDINNTSTYYQFAVMCQKYGIKAVFGIEFRNEDQLLFLKNRYHLRLPHGNIVMSSIGTLIDPSTPTWTMSIWE